MTARSWGSLHMCLKSMLPPKHHALVSFLKKGNGYEKLHLFASGSSRAGITVGSLQTKPEVEVFAINGRKGKGLDSRTSW